MDTKILEQIGLSKNEIKVYFALLELDQSTTTAIIKKADIPTSKIYPVLDKLIKKGLVSYVIKKKKKHYQASDPHGLIDFLQKKQKEIDLQEKEIEKLIPIIELKRKLAKEKQEATVYEGIEGVKAGFSLILNTIKAGETYYSFTLSEEVGKKDLIRFFKKHHQKRREKKINVKLIVQEKIRKIIIEHYQDLKRDIRYTTQKLPIGVIIFKDHVMTIVWGENPTAFVIKSKNNYKYYKEFFEEMWKNALK